MRNVLRAMYAKFGVQKSNIIVTIAVSAFASIGVISAVGTAYAAGHINGAQDMSDRFLAALDELDELDHAHGAELYEKDKEDDHDE